MAMSSTSLTGLPWPECLGTFDEDSCRFFLRELGEKVVQFYPFSIGMEEAFSHIVQEYGFEGAPDALGVLQEMLEDDNSAAGAGDDGDIWRSWRHNWRHRNDDLHNPYVPRLRGRILPPATSTRIRLLKAANFATCQQAKATYGVKSTTSCGAPSPTVDHTGASTAGPQSKTLGISEAVSEYHQALRDDTTHRENSNELQKRSPNASSVSSQPSEEHALLATKRCLPRLADNSTGSPRLSMPAPLKKNNFPFDLLSPKRSRSTSSPTGQRLPHEHNHAFNVGTIPEEEHTVEGSTSLSLFSSRSAIDNVADVGASDRSERTPPSQRLFQLQDNRFSLPSDFGSTDAEGTPIKRRATHRQARMIDGALFHGKSRKEKCIDDEKQDHHFPVKVVPENMNKHSQKSSRASWLHNVLTRLQGKQSRKAREPKLRKRHSSLGDCGLVISQNGDRDITASKRAIEAHIPEMRQTTSLAVMGFDGSFDDDISDRNKPLPLSPLELGHNGRPSVQSETERLFFAKTPETTASNSPVSFVSSGITKIREKDELRSLVSATMSGPQELSPRRNGIRYRWSNASSGSAPSSPKTFTTFAKKNPYRDSDEPQTPALPQLAPLTYHKDQVSSTVWPFRGPADSIDLEENTELEGDNGFLPLQKATTPRGRAGAASEDVARRGRRPATPPASPSRSKFGFQGRSPTKTPRPRSRSPVKKIIGMVKSMSTSQIPNERSLPKSCTPTSTNKRRWKELSHKLRNGFLTADLEQLEQEEMMEQYVSDNDKSNAVHIVTPPILQPRTLFPVSIKSAGQSKLWSELEYMLIETCNNFLKVELEAGRLSRESVLKLKHQWQARNRPQIIEFYYDQATQYELVIGNLRDIKLYSDYCQDAVLLNSVLHQWKILIRELSVKTLCMPDSIVRRWLHDGRRVLELLGASHITLANMDKLTTLCMAVIGSAEKERAKRRPRADTTNSLGNHRRSVSDGSTTTLHKHEQALLYGRNSPPPLPTPPSSSNNPSPNHKVTPEGSASLQNKVTTSGRATPQQIFEHAQQRKAARAQAQGPAQAQMQSEHCRIPTDSKPFLFQNGNGYSHGPGRLGLGHNYSKSLTPGEERARFIFD